MSKINLFLLFGCITIFVSSKRWEDNSELLVNLLIHFFDGMSEKGECPKRWIKNKEKITDIVRDILNRTQSIIYKIKETEEKTISLTEFLNMEEFEDIIRSNAIEFITIKRLAENCNLLNAIPILMAINTEGFGDHFYNYYFNTTENSKRLYDKLINATDNDSRYKVFGKMVSEYFNNFTVF